jgi:hypothetical protein
VNCDHIFRIATKVSELRSRSPDCDRNPEIEIKMQEFVTEIRGLRLELADCDPNPAVAIKIAGS